MITRLFKLDRTPASAAVLASRSSGRAAGGAGEAPIGEPGPLRPLPPTQPVNDRGWDIERVLRGGFRSMPMPGGLSNENGGFALLTDGQHVVGLRRIDMAQLAKGYFFASQLRKAIPHALLLDVTAARMREVEALDEAQQQATRSYSNTTAQQLGYELVGLGIELDVSDIHVDIERIGPQAPSVLVRFRLHGELYTHEHLRDAQSVKVWDEVVRSLFQDERTGVAGERNTSILSSSAGRFYRRLQLPLRNAELRFEADTTSTGVKAALRILTYDGKPTVASDLVGLGLSPDQSDAVLQAFAAPHGLIIWMGATGAGKTSLIANAMKMHPHPERQCRLGMEQPPEIAIPFMSQLLFPEDQFEEALRGALRQDPDVIYVGEINSAKTAVLAMQAAMSGHLVPATLHGNNVESGLLRLVGEQGMQVPLQDICADDVMRLLGHQALVPTLCTECRQHAIPFLSRAQLSALEELEVDPTRMYVRHQAAGNGCCACGGRGIGRRTAIAEVVRPTAEFRRAMLRGGVAAAMEVHRATRRAGFGEADQTGKNHHEHGLYKASQGQICTLQLLQGFDVTAHEVVLRKQRVRRHAREAPPPRPSAGSAAGGTLENLPGKFELVGEP